MPAIIAAIVLALVGALTFGAAGKRMRPRRSRRWFRLLGRGRARDGQASKKAGEDRPA